MKKIINITLITIAVISLLSITASNIYHIVSNERDYQQDLKLLEQLEDYNQSWDEIKELLNEKY